MLSIFSVCQVRDIWGQESARFWQSQSIYQVITDRFFDGDPGNNNVEGTCKPKGRGGTAVHGGDFKGLEKKLDYIKALGATAIWISPVVLNANGEFHGYAARDFYSVAPHWGTMGDLQQLSAAAHRRGLRMILDVVANHGGDLVYSIEPGFPKFRPPPDGYDLRYRGSKQFAAPFNTNDANPYLTNLFHNHGNIQNYSDSLQAELGELSGLDDLRTESPYVRSNLVEIYKYWIREGGFDGFRVDTVKHVEMDFWQSWCPQIRAYARTNGKTNFFMFGEVYDQSDAKCGFYTGRQAGGAFAFDSVLDYPLYFKINSVFATAKGPTRQIEDRYATLSVNYAESARDGLVTFLDNHDQPRFLSASLANNNFDRLKVALVFLYTARGIPCLYYGTEQGFNGATDPYDREDMFAGEFEQGPSLGDNFNMTHPLFQWVARLNNFRRLYRALTLGVHSNRSSDAGGPGLLAYARIWKQQEVFVALNTAGSSQVLTNVSTTYPAGTRLVNLLDAHETVIVLPGSILPGIPVPGSAAKVFIAEAEFRPLDPVVVAVTPNHDSAAVAASSPVIFQFNEPMETNSVQKGFSTVPPVSGTWSWSPSADRVTFSPMGAGFPAQTWVSIRLAATSRGAVSGKPFYGEFESRFQTDR